MPWLTTSLSDEMLNFDPNRSLGPGMMRIGEVGALLDKSYMYADLVCGNPTASKLPFMEMLGTPYE